jgi:hypothetical protein
MQSGKIAHRGVAQAQGTLYDGQSLDTLVLAQLYLCQPDLVLRIVRKTTNETTVSSLGLLEITISNFQQGQAILDAGVLGSKA